MRVTKNIINTDRLILKPYSENDKNDFIELLTNEEIKKTFMISDFKTNDEAVKMFYKLLALSQSDEHYEVGIYRDDRLIGFINDVDIDDTTIELGCAIHPDYHNMGYGTEVIGAAIDDLFQMGFDEVIAGAFESNKASCRMMEKCGMKRMDKEEDISYHGKMHHCIYFSIKKEPVKIIIGAGETSYQGWTSTQEDEFNLLHIDDYYRLFGREESVDAFLAEHVFEHLSYEDGIKAAKNLYRFLKPGGYVRAAVPDVNFRNEWYHNMCKPGGPGRVDHPAYTHKIFYDYKTFIKVFESAGFKVDLLEYCDDDGRFHFNYWSPEQGFIGRSLRFDTRNSDGSLGMVSIIIDAYKK